jgi:arylsulfatase A-like enzyme
MGSDAFSATTQPVKQAPNILFIMADDHSANAIGAYGSRINQTPNIDRIANEGIRLDHCYVTNSICTPSRATILTGMHNHVNRVTTLASHIDNRLPNVAKYLKLGGYQTAMVGKWHLGTGPMHCPTGFDFWSVLPGQGHYVNPIFHEMAEEIEEQGYVTDIITDKSLYWLQSRDTTKPFFLMCHHKAPHREWDPKPEHRSLYNDPIPKPRTFDDDYSNRAKAAAAARMRISQDLCYRDLDLVPPVESRGNRGGEHSRIPFPSDEELGGFGLRCAITGEWHTFANQAQLKDFKYQRYMRKYLQTVHSIDENVGRLLDYLDENGLSEDTIVIYTSDQGFYLGEHGWFDKRFIYEESFQMPFLVRYPREIPAGSVNTDMTSNVDFAQTFLHYAGLTSPNFMQGRSFRDNLRGRTPDDWTDLAYHRYWMNGDLAHNVHAHYGIRTRNYKLIYWYNDGLGEEGTHPCEDPPEWELFDLTKDSLELFNVYHDPAYALVVEEMRQKLDTEMARIGDIPEHAQPSWKKNITTK